MSQYEIEKSAPMATQIGSIANHVERFFAFIRERHAVYHRRAAGNPRPWTDDPILREYSFCNIYREFDRTTRWIAENWRTPHATDPDLFFAMGIARLVNLPETLAELGYPVPWNAEHFLAVLGDRKARDERMYSGAYILGTGGRGGYGEKPDYQAQAIFAPLWRARDRLRPRAGESLREFHNRLGDFHGMGGFITAQVIADLKYAEPLRSALDWETYAASGPGSRRGLNLVFGRPADQRWDELRWRDALAKLREQTRPMFEAAGMDVPHAQDLQNCLCEFSKYERARLGGRMPKRRFKPHDGGDAIGGLIAAE
jgi:hypothetical protein